MKDKKRLLIITEAVILVPVIIGFLLWNRLPESIPIHFDTSGNPDGYTSRFMGIILIPLILVIAQLVVYAATAFDPKNQNVSSKINSLILWIMPCVSLAVSTFVYSSAMGTGINVSNVILILEGLLFAVIGNYLPKTRHNYTIGIRLPWTLDNEENWERTHRFAGPVWVIGGIVLIAAGFLGVNSLIVLPVILILTIVPTVYSWNLYRTHKEA